MHVQNKNLTLQTVQTILTYLKDRWGSKYHYIWNFRLPENIWNLKRNAAESIMISEELALHMLSVYKVGKQSGQNIHVLFRTPACQICSDIDSDSRRHTSVAWKAPVIKTKLIINIMSIWSFMYVTSMFLNEDWLFGTTRTTLTQKLDPRETFC